ncbi:MAG: hypothetical protein EBS61_11005, partial [Betaproteobacteria bacterium]|nr:hypothetical protein [Betaproteobacteria bacterium]
SLRLARLPAQTALQELAVLLAPAVSIARATLPVSTWPIEQKAHLAKRSKALHRTLKASR